MALDQRHRFLITKLVEAFGIEETVVERKFNVEKPHISAFFDGSGPGALRWSYQVPEERSKDGQWVPKGSKPVLQLTHQQGERLSGKCLFFVRVNPKGVSEKTLEADVAVGEVQGSALDTFRALLADLFLPVLQEQSSWGKMPPQHTKDFLTGAGRTAAVLADASNCLQGSIELKLPDPKYAAAYELKPGSFNAAANDPEVARHMDECLTDWCRQVDSLLERSSAPAAGEEPGPDTELEHWRQQMSRFNSLTEQLKTHECRLVLGVTSMTHSQANKRWKGLEMRLTDAANEAKDNVRYLATLDQPFEVLKSGNPQQVLDSLHTLLQSIMTLYKIARYYGTPQRMTTLFSKITNQMIRLCKDSILAPGKLWDQDKATLISNMQLCVRLCEAYKQQYISLRDAMKLDNPEKPFEMDERAVFLRFELFAKRLNKLISMFTTVHQFSSLERHTHIAGLEGVLKAFWSIVDDVKRKPYDLLDFSRTQFDRDYLEFNVNIHDLEISLQAFINSSFENISSTQHALSLLAQFKAILLRESLREELDSKVQVIFQHYARDLEAVQVQYEAQKHNPPVPHNVPPTAGNIMWSRQLLSRIEEPMQLFAQNKPLMAMKESKKVIKLYNRVAKALVEFETLWHQAWLKGIEQQRAGLQAPLLVRHPDTGRLLVNLDKELMQLIKESKYLQRMGVHVPEVACTLLLQEERFKFYFAQLSHLVREFEDVMARMQPVFKPLLKPHLEDLEKKVAPGLFILTWASMNIDGYLHRFKQGLARLEELVRKLMDIVDNRVQANLDTIRAMQLVELPADRSFSYEEFIAAQDKFQKRQADHLAVLNEEVARAIEDVIELVQNAPRENPDVSIEPREVELFRSYYSSLMYKAILGATQRSFAAMKRRLGSKATTGIFYMERPFFNVDVELKVPNIALNPTLDGIQNAINSTAKAILQASNRLRCWGMVNGPPTYHDLIARDKEVVKSVLLLTGSIEHIKQQVAEYLAKFDKYSFLWTQDLQSAYEAFMKQNPELEAFEAELKKYMAIETEVSNISPVYNIGSLSLETVPLKNALKSEAASWKARFAQNLHGQSAEDLKAFDTYIRDTTVKLGRKVEDLEDVRYLVNILNEVREKEADIDALITPIEEMYSLLLRYEVRVPKEETGMVSDLRYGWKKLRKLGTEVSDNLARLQVGFKRVLVKEVAAFVQDAQAFRRDWEANGPMVAGLSPMEAVDRLKKFQQMFEVRKRKWENYSSGEELFGLKVTKYPELEQTEKEVTMLDRLYTLYATVVSTIKGYGDYFWVDVVEKIDEWGEQVLQYQNQCRKLPKALRDWQAYVDCRDTIDNFLEMLPLFQALAHKAMRERHWKSIMQITGHELQLAEDVFKLQHLLECNILRHREELEEITNAAVKEEQIETKLAVIESDWAALNLVFADYKTRGPVILKPSDTAELIEKLEDSQMQLGSMATNR